MNLIASILVVFLAASAFHSAEAQSLRARELENDKKKGNEELAPDLIVYFEYESKARPRPRLNPRAKLTHTVATIADEAITDETLEEKLKLIGEVAELEEDEAEELELLAEDVSVDGND